MGTKGAAWTGELELLGPGWLYDMLDEGREL